MTCRHPRVPHLVHAGEIARDVGEPDLRGHEPRLVDAGLFEKAVDLLEDLRGLHLDVGRRIGGRLAADEDEAGGLDDAAHARIGFDANDFGHDDKRSFAMTAGGKIQ